MFEDHLTCDQHIDGTCSLFLVEIEYLMQILTNNVGNISMCVLS